MRTFEIVAGRLNVAETTKRTDAEGKEITEGSSWSLSLDQAAKMLPDFPDMPEALRLEIEAASQ